MDNLPTAIIADDEPLLSRALASELNKLWPELSIIATVSNGPAAIEAIMQHQPNVAFLDIKMPGATGIEVVETIADEWPNYDNNDARTGNAPPLIVFVTAFHDYAVDAFETAAIDYVVKPVTSARLHATVTRLRDRLKTTEPDMSVDLSNQIRRLLEAEQSLGQNSDSVAPLRIIRSSVGDSVRMIPVEKVILFESADKYVSVHAEGRESLIRESLRNLLPQLDNKQFVQIHRGAIVNLNCVRAAVKDDTGKLTLQLDGTDKTPVVSRVYRHLFQAM
jgi:DNA-binding LytR/AlgR family response regulator